MKKFLSLVLALIMVMSLVTVGAGATFTDAAEIEQTEAVALLSGLGIIGGYGDGSFKPGNSISRGAAAKIITWMTIGTAKVDAMTADGVDEVPFPDVRKNSSTAVFIEYCKEQEIIGGYSDGTFRPYADLTGYAFLKMALVALGVDDIDFSAKGWQIDAAAKAEDMGLLDGIDTDEVDLSVALSRENACQIAYNSLGYTASAATYYPVLDKVTDEVLMKCTTKEDQVLYAKLLEGKVGAPVTDKKDSLGSKIFNLGEHTGIVTKNGATDAVVANAGKTTVSGETFDVETGLDMIGHKVTVYYNTKTEDVYTIYDESTTVALKNKTTDLADLAAALDVKTSKMAEVTYDYTKYDGTYAVTSNVTTALVNTDEESDSYKKGTKGTAIVAYDETAEKNVVIGFVLPTTKTLSKVTDIDTKNKTITLNGIGTLNNGKKVSEKANDAIVEYADIAEKDYVVVTEAQGIYTVAKAETVTGKITKIDGTKITVNGTTYSNAGTNKSGIVGSALNFTDEYTLYLNGTSSYFVAKAVTESATKEVVFFVDGYTKTTTKEDAYEGTKNVTTYWAQCVNMNGEIVTFQTTEELALANGLYTVTLAEVEALDDGIEYATFAVKGVSSNDDITAKTLKVSVAGQDSVYYFADDVKFISVQEHAPENPADYDNSKLKTSVKTGVQEVKNPMYFTATAVKDAEGNETGNYTVDCVFVDGKFATVTAQPTDDIVYAIETKDSTAQVPYVKSNKTEIGFEHTVYIDGVKTTIVTTAATKLQGFITLTKVVDGVYKTAAATAANLIDDADITNIFNGMITVDETITIDGTPTAIEDIDVADADIFDLRDEDDLAEGKSLVDDADGLEKGMKLAIVVDTTNKEALAIATIYVVG